MLTIGKVAKQTGVSASAIRYYERQGLLRSSRLVNGYRIFDENVLKRLRFLVQAQTLGLALVHAPRVCVGGQNGPAVGRKVYPGIRGALPTETIMTSDDMGRMRRRMAAGSVV